VAITQDADGNEARAVRSVWLAGDNDWWFGGDNGDRMDVIAEKQEYKSPTPPLSRFACRSAKATALVTVEREGVMSSFVVPKSAQPRGRGQDAGHLRARTSMFR
jgi:hypothetical protein